MTAADNWAFFNELEDCHGDLVRFHAQHSDFYDDGDAGLVEQLVHEVEDCGGLVQIGKTYFELAFLEDQEGYRAVSISELQEGKALKPTTFALARIPNTYADSFKSAMTECIQYINAYLNDDVWYWRVDRSDGAELDHDYGYIGRPAAMGRIYGMLRHQPLPRICGRHRNDGDDSGSDRGECSDDRKVKSGFSCPKTNPIGDF